MRLMVSARSRNFFLGLATLSAFLILTSSAWAQATSTNSVGGQVVDPQNAAVPGAEVTLTESATSEKLSTKTNNDGRYIFINVGSGTYSISISKTGFSTVQTQGLQVVIGEPVTYNATLAVGTTATTIEVSASAAELVTSNASVGASLTGAMLLDLPNMGRDVATLAILQPGTTQAGTFAGATAGAVSDQNTYQIDGGNATGDMLGNVTSYQTNFAGIRAARRLAPLLRPTSRRALKAWKNSRSPPSTRQPILITFDRRPGSDCHQPRNQSVS